MVDSKSQIEHSISQVRKRDGSVSDFNRDKILNAIYKAFSASNKPDKGLAIKLSDGVLIKLTEHGFSANNPPSVEAIQDLVESTLIDQGHSDIAKSYILYRHERRKIREEKMKVLNTKRLDSVGKSFDINCLRVLASRYLFRDNKNEIIEKPSELFERVAVLVSISDLIRDNYLFTKDGGMSQNIEEAAEYLKKLDGFSYKFKIGSYYLNKWHFRCLINCYVELAKQGMMKVSFKELLTMLASKKFDAYADRISEYYELMISQDFLPNSPTMMNAGGRLGQLSACIVLGMPDDMQSIMKTTSDAALILSLIHI